MAGEYDVSIIGAGAMGHGLAVQTTLTGHNTTLVDHRQENIDRARGQIESVVQFLNDQDQESVDRSAEDVLESIQFTLDTDVGVESADVVIESISEDKSAKQEIFRTVGDSAPSDAILGSNTSSIPITEIAEGVPEYADRIVGCHWWFPPYLLSPVEIVEGEQTSDETIARVEAFIDAVERKPIHVRRDVPGFVWNRVQMAVMRECLHIVEEGIASIEDVNTAIRDGYAVRTATIGPFETADIAGLDLFNAVAKGIYPELANDDEPQKLLQEHIADGRTGVDAGAGLFEYDVDLETVTRRRDKKIAAIRRALDESSGQ